ncbi:MAG: transposase zinc-binding domain-containing protein [Alteromonadaceae bacterium]|nr:transposase zinc-binding domain-containing protein [Alteromonadaceae bacterium]
MFTGHCSAFVIHYFRYNTDYCYAEIKKCSIAVVKAIGFAVYECLLCGEGHQKAHFSCKGKVCPQCGKRYARDYNQDRYLLISQGELSSGSVYLTVTAEDIFL